MLPPPAAVVAEAVRGCDPVRFADLTPAAACTIGALEPGFCSDVALRALAVRSQIEGKPPVSKPAAPRAGADGEWRSLVCGKFVYTSHQIGLCSEGRSMASEDYKLKNVVAVAMVIATAVLVLGLLGIWVRF